MPLRIGSTALNKEIEGTLHSAPRPGPQHPPAVLCHPAIHSSDGFIFVYHRGWPFDEGPHIAGGEKLKGFV